MGVLFVWVNLYTLFMQQHPLTRFFCLRAKRVLLNHILVNGSQMLFSGCVRFFYKFVHILYGSEYRIQVIDVVGIHRFIAVSADNTGNTRIAREIVSSRLPTSQILTTTSTTHGRISWH